MKTLVAATGNVGKVKEFQEALQKLQIQVRSLKGYPLLTEPEETGTTFRENALLKACYYGAHLKMPCLADDSGLEVDALGGMPGVYSARYAGPQSTDQTCNTKLLEALKEISFECRTARFRSVLVFRDTDGTILTAEGVCEGQILETPRGQGGFGYDPLFFKPDAGKSLAEMSLAEKNAVSHRGQALRDLLKQLQEYWHL